MKRDCKSPRLSDQIIPEQVVRADAEAVGDGDYKVDGWLVAPAFEKADVSVSGETQLFREFNL